jgi:two-component system KDP operon response regulator KdpE
LVVDEEPALRKTLCAYFSAQGYVVTAVASGETAVEAVESLRPDVVLLDVVMPGTGGLEACKQIRARSSVSIIVLSVMNAERDKVEVLQAGADDYLTKPFGVEELAARIGVALRRRARVASGEVPVYHCADLTIDIGQRLVMLCDGEIRLTPIEYDLLRCLASRSGQIVTQAILLSEVWGPGHELDVQLLRFGIFQLRRKLNDEPLRPKYIFTEPGIGYRFGVKPL